MRSSIRLALSALLVALSAILPTVLAVEKLLLISPLDLVSAVGTPQITEVPALFGNPSYRTTLSGRAFYATPRDGCTPLDSNPIWRSETSVFAVLDRGNCSFVTKVRNAQIAGARAALIADNVDESRRGMPLMADDGTGSNVIIPSVMMDYTQANNIKNWLMAHSDSSNQVSLTYGLPNPDNRVEWDFFTNSWEKETVQFKAAMIPVIKALDKNQYFTPHYYVMDGEQIGCTVVNCANQCINNGYYCAVDPDRDLDSGLSGQDVLVESIRQLCVWNWLNQTYGEGRNQYILFEYMNAQNTVCNVASNPDLWRSGACQNATLKSLGVDVNAIHTCMATSNYTDESGVSRNVWLEKMLADQIHFGLFYTPAAFVNLTPYRGAFCTPPIPNQGCAIVDMICQGFDADDIPAVCSTQPASCPFGVTRDCSLSCGTKVVDACGSCLEIRDQRFNQSCIDKSGSVCVLPLTLDSCRVCGGDGSTCSSSSSLSTGAIVGIVFGALILVAIVGVGVYFYMQYQSKKMREDIDSLLKQYLPLESGVNSGGVQQKNGRLVETSEHDL